MKIIQGMLSVLDFSSVLICTMACTRITYKVTHISIGVF